jgi:hypothetical protein
MLFGGGGSGEGCVWGGGRGDMIYGVMRKIRKISERVPCQGELYAGGHFSSSNFPNTVVSQYHS